MNRLSNGLGDEMVEINLRTLKRDGHTDLAETVCLPRIAESSIDISSVDDVGVTGTATFADPLILLEGTLSTTVHYICSRCLTVFEKPLNTRLNTAYTTSPEQNDDDIPLAEGQVLDMTLDLEESIFLGLDDRPLCKEDCLGLCSVCGKNQNEETCQCETRAVDPRLAGLKDLLYGTDSE